MNTQTITIRIAEDSTVEPDENFTLTLTDGSQAHTPDSGAVVADAINLVDGVQSATIVDDDMAIVSIGTASVFETSGNFIISVPVTVDVGVQGGFDVEFDIDDITATLGDDYQVLTTSPLSFDGTPGQTVNIEIEILGDSNVEGDEQFRIVLTEATPNDANIDPANILLDGAAESSATLVIDGSTFDETPPSDGPLLITSTTNDADLLVQNLVGLGIDIVGTPEFTGTENSAGFFVNGSSSIGIESGILLTTGDANLANGPNASGTAGSINGLPGDPDLTAIAGLATNDATALEFQFETDGGDLFFDFVFASEEYNEFVESGFTDAFGFFLDGVNIGLIPGTSTPITIDTVNLDSNSEFFNDNSDLALPAFDLVEYDGFTDVFTAQALNLSPGVHTIRLVIADGGDSSFDSAVFFRAGSFSGTAGSPLSITNTSTDPSTQIDQITLDISGLDLAFDSSDLDGSNSFPFTSVAGTDVTTGLSGVTVVDGGSTLTLDFTDFDPGETFSYQIDVDSLGLDDVISGNQLIGASGVVTFSNGLTATGTIEAVPGNPDAATFVLTAVPDDAGLVTILNDDIDLNLEAALVDVQDEGTGTNTTYTFEVTRDGFITDSTENTTVTYTVSGTGTNPATGDDFVGGAFPTGTVTFGPDETSMLITVEVAGDSLAEFDENFVCLLYTSPSPRDQRGSRMPSSA